MDEHATTFEAPESLSTALAAVEHGHDVTITRDGEPVARLVRIGGPDRVDAASSIDEERRRRVLEALAGLQSIARTVRPKVTVDEIIAWKNEGRP